MVRKFLTFDGEVIDERDWQLKPTDYCFYCDESLITADRLCPDSQDFNHDFITLINPSEFRR